MAYWSYESLKCFASMLDMTVLIIGSNMHQINQSLRHALLLYNEIIISFFNCINIINKLEVTNGSVFQACWQRVDIIDKCTESHSF